MQHPSLGSFGIQGRPTLGGVWIVKRQRTVAVIVGCSESMDSGRRHPHVELVDRSCIGESSLS